jgi:hypothetical protein
VAHQVEFFYLNKKTNFAKNKIKLTKNKEQNIKKLKTEIRKKTKKKTKNKVKNKKNTFYSTAPP